MLLKQSTSVVLPFGPFVSQTDGVTLVTSLVSALDNGTTGIKLSKNGGALTIRHASVTATTYDAYGNYLVTLDTTDTNTLGSLRVQFADATTNLPVWADFQVVPPEIYDSLVLNTGAFNRAIRNIVIGTVGSASSTTSIITSACTPNAGAADSFKGRIVVFDKDTTTAALRGQATDITANTSGATPTLTVTALTTAPVSGDTFTIQ